ncbi:hypothetical protein ANN_27829 [Periplaneta americana]|uniref:Uncharacterized protein n=1 Tax=Periplaneta americana TaxID=6978 RepID=A0ABQ8RVD7_PERAM|nr:hypothetical protein ANN_27829 [Periplaneta americana]
MSYYSEEYVDQEYALTSEVKFEEVPVPVSSAVLKREPEERNLLDQHVTGIKTEHVDQSPDLTSEVKLEVDSMSISFAVVKHEPEEKAESHALAGLKVIEISPATSKEYQSDLDAVTGEPKLEVTIEDNEVFAERVGPPAWELGEGLTIHHPEQSIDYYETKKKKPWFDEDCSIVVGRRKQTKLKFLEEPVDVNRDTHFNERREASRTLRNK